MGHGGLGKQGSVEQLFDDSVEDVNRQARQFARSPAQRFSHAGMRVGLSRFEEKHGFSFLACCIQCFSEKNRKGEGDIAT